MTTFTEALRPLFYYPAYTNPAMSRNMNRLNTTSLFRNTSRAPKQFNRLISATYLVLFSLNFDLIFYTYREKPGSLRIFYSWHTLRLTTTTTPNAGIHPISIECSLMTILVCKGAHTLTGCGAFFLAF